jgi:hypothetical protein
MLERAARYLRIGWARAGLGRGGGRGEGNARGLAARYLADPVATARLDARSAAKLDRAFARVEAGFGWPRAAAIERILALAARRLEDGGPTLYLNNVGSSGSHWLMGMLREGAGILGQGEIYLPLPFLYARIDPLAPAEKGLFLQAVYLAHLITGAPADARAPLANSAHLTDLAAYTRNDPGARRVLLLRDPVEVVLSRTLRKPAYRRLLGREGMSDLRYLRENLRLVRRFHARAERVRYDLVVRYEDLRRDPLPGLAAIAGLAGLAADPGGLAAAAGAARLSAARAAAASRPNPELRRVAERELAGLRRRLGYG